MRCLLTCRILFNLQFSISSAARNKTNPVARQSAQGKNVTHVAISRHSDGNIFVVYLNRGPPKKAIDGAFADGLVVAMAGKTDKDGNTTQSHDSTFHDDLKEANFIPVFADATPRKSFEDNSAIQVELVKPKPGLPPSLPMKAFVFYYDETTGGPKQHALLMQTLTTCIVSALERSDKIKVDQGKLRRLPVYAEWSDDNDLSQSLDNEKSQFKSPDHVLTNAGVVNLAIWGFVKCGDATEEVEESSTDVLIMYHRHEKVKTFFSPHPNMGFCADACVKLGFPFSDKQKLTTITARTNLLNAAIRANIEAKTYDDATDLLDSLCEDMLSNIWPTQLTPETWITIDNLITFVVIDDKLKSVLPTIANFAMKFYNAHPSETGTREKLQSISGKSSDKRKTDSTTTITTKPRSKKAKSTTLNRAVTLSQDNEK